MRPAHRGSQTTTASTKRGDARERDDHLSPVLVQLRFARRRGPSHQPRCEVERRKHHQPYCIDEVPVENHVGYRKMIAACEVSAKRTDENHSQHQESDENMSAMKSCRSKKRRCISAGVRPG